MILVPEDQFLDWLKQRDMADRTQSEYLIYLKKMNAYGSFNQKNIDSFMLSNRNNVARATLLSMKRFLLRNPVDLGISLEQAQFIRNIEIESVKSKRRKVPQVPSREQILAIESAMKSEGLKLMLMLTYYCALRAHELLKLRLNDFNWSEWKMFPEDNGRLTFKGKGGITSTVPVKQELMARLRDWINETYGGDENFKIEQPLFPKKYEAWKYLIEKYSVKTIGKSVNPHLLRHAFGMHLAEKGVDLLIIKNLLRHKDIGTTQLYARASPKIVDEVYENF